MDATLEKLLKVILKKEEEEKKTSVDQLFVATLNIKSWNKRLIYLRSIEGHYGFIVV